jgi:hypothetical protein
VLPFCRFRFWACCSVFVYFSPQALHRVPRPVGPRRHSGVELVPQWVHLFSSLSSSSSSSSVSPFRLAGSGGASRRSILLAQVNVTAGTSRRGQKGFPSSRSVRSTHSCFSSGMGCRSVSWRW